MPTSAFRKRSDKNAAAELVTRERDSLPRLLAIEFIVPAPTASTTTTSKAIVLSALEETIHAHRKSWNRFYALVHAGSR